MNGKLASLAVQTATETEWYVVNTNPRSENAVYDQLKRAGHHCFLPSYGRRVRRRFTTSHRLVFYPLFTGYLFVELPRRGVDWFALRRVNGVKDVLGRRADTDRILPVGRAEVAELMRLCNAGTFTERAPNSRPFKRSDMVLIKEGPFRGFVCHFDDYTGHKSARLLANIFGGLSPVETALDDIVFA